MTTLTPPLRALAAAIAVAMVAGCGGAARHPIVSAPVTDPYVARGGGVAVYQGNANRPGTRLPGTPPADDTAEIQRQFAGIGDTVYFAEADAGLSQEARQALTRQAEWLAEHANHAALIEGHADEPGTREFNLALGARRATSVQEYLVAKGVAPTRLRTVSYGKERPAVACTGAADCLARNRRAVTIVTPGAAGV